MHTNKLIKSDNMKKILFASAVAVMAAMAFVGCSDDDKEGTAQVPATGVSLDVTEQTLDIGQTLQLTATPAPVNTTDRVVWRSDKESVATVSETGLVKAVAAGTATVEAVCGTVSASCVVRVIDPYQEYDVISFETSEGLIDIKGKLLVLGDVEVVGGDAAATHKNVFWGKSYVSFYGKQDQSGSTYIDLPLFGTPDDEFSRIVQILDSHVDRSLELRYGIEYARVGNSLHSKTVVYGDDVIALAYQIVVILQVFGRISEPGRESAAEYEYHAGAFAH